MNLAGSWESTLSEMLKRLWVLFFFSFFFFPSALPGRAYTFVEGKGSGWGIGGFDFIYLLIYFF